MNTWPGGVKKGLFPKEHEDWNSFNFPGTRQLCVCCENPTGRCAEDSIYIDDHEKSLGPLCEDCYNSYDDPQSSLKF